MSTSTTQAIYERLKSDLLAGRLRPGRRLKISDLGAAFDVSIGAVREALSRLTADGLVVAEPQRGFHTPPVALADIRDLTMVRVEIEGLCLRQAIARGTLAWETAIVAAHHRLSRTPLLAAADDAVFSDAWLAAHADFHRALAQACDSPWLMKLREMLFLQSERYRALCLSLDGSGRDAGREHRELMEAVLARDADLAVARMTAHIALTTAVIETALRDAPPD